MNIFSHYENFKSLDFLGFPNYAINIYGEIINTQTGTIKKESEPNRYNLFFIFGNNLRESKYPKIHLVAEAWYLQDRALWKNSPYVETIERYLEFFLIPCNDKKQTEYVNSYGNYYWITRSGEVWEDGFRLKVKPRYSKEGYADVSLAKIPYFRNRNVSVHRLVAKAFCPIPQHLLDLGHTFDTLEVNHKDANPINNRWWNLEWVVGMENQLHRQQKYKRRKYLASDELLRNVCFALSNGDLVFQVAQKFKLPFDVVMDIQNGVLPEYQQEFRQMYAMRKVQYP